MGLAVAPETAETSRVELPSHVADLLGRTRRQGTIVAVLGASNDRSKFGNIIVRDLVRKGFSVRPINPHASEVCGLPCHPTLAAAGRIHIADFVVPPEVSRRIVSDLKGSEADVLWFQPGSFDAEVVALARTKVPLVVAGPCIMVEAE
ncbi:MAG: CoA-binding protein [Deltaproteobacteria bacterium]|nr:CoA-binding protein [Deltaproteobacteria bacterium]